MAKRKESESGVSLDLKKVAAIAEELTKGIPKPTYLIRRMKELSDLPRTEVYGPATRTASVRR